MIITATLNSFPTSMDKREGVVVSSVRRRLLSLFSLRLYSGSSTTLRILAVAVVLPLQT